MMMGNLHTHTTYCDGNYTPEEIVKTAIDKGFSYIGFSGHSYTFFDDTYAMTKENTDKYFEDIASLKEKYDGKITVLCGIEKDAFSDYPTDRFDYTIASCHYVKVGDSYYEVDHAESIQKETIENIFGGDHYAYAENYFESVGNMTGDIIGHFDLVTKFDREEKIFTPKEARYKKAALSAIEKLCSKNSVFEVNTGAMARGYKDAPYPAKWILEELKKHNSRVIITSDFHRNDTLDYAFTETAKMLSNMGFKDFFNIDFIQNRK